MIECGDEAEGEIDRSIEQMVMMIDDVDEDEDRDDDDNQVGSNNNTCSMISRIIQTEVNVICRSRRLRRITLTEVWIILDIMSKPNPMIVYYTVE